MAADNAKDETKLDQFLKKKKVEPTKIEDSGAPEPDLVDKLQLKLREEAHLDETFAQDESSEDSDA